MNKRGLAYEMVVWIPRLVYLTIVILSVNGIILAYTVNSTNIGDAESHILLHRLQFSQDGIAKHDPATGRVYAGVVDNRKLSKDNLQQILKVREGRMAARFAEMGFDEDNKIVVYLDEPSYAAWQPIAAALDEASLESGTGGRFPHKEVRYVYSDEPSKLETVVITRNE